MLIRLLFLVANSRGKKGTERGKRWQVMPLRSLDFTAPYAIQCQNNSHCRHFTLPGTLDFTRVSGFLFQKRGRKGANYIILISEMIWLSFSFCFCVMCR